MCVIAERLKKLFGVCVHISVTKDLCFKVFKLILGGERTIDEKVRGLEVRRTLGELLNGITSGLYVRGLIEEAPPMRYAPVTEY